MKEGKIFYALNDRIIFLKLLGRITFAGSYGFDNFINEVFNKDMADRFFLDLRKTQYIDSTNLGLIAKIAIKGQKKEKEKPIIISNNENINIILQSMGFYDVFTIISDHGPEVNSLTELNGLQENKKQLAKVMLEAHETLVEINEHNKNTFSNVIDLLKKEI